jgi:hypothetical protein
VGARNHKKTESELPSSTGLTEQSGSSEENPFLIFKEGVGRKSLKESYLCTRRDEWIHLLEPIWHEIGWVLEAARKIEHIQESFELMKNRTSTHLIAPFLRKNVVKATKAQLDSTREAYEQVVEQLGKNSGEHRESSNEYQDMQRMLFELSENHRNQLAADLKQRRARIRDFRVERSRAKSRLRKYKRLREQYRAPTEKSGRDFTPQLERKILGIERDIEADERVCVDLEARLGHITPENRGIAAEEDQNQQEKLNLLTEALKKETGRCDELQEKLLNQEAYYCQTELLKFVNSGDYAIEPRHLANALAGLPHLTCRRSAERCSRLKSTVGMAFNYELFRFIQLRWNRRMSRGDVPLLNWFRTEILKLPKTIRGEKQKEKQKNALRLRLAADWFFLRRAIEDVQALKNDRVPQVYFIAQRFIQESLNPSNLTDKLLANKERLI